MLSIMLQNLDMVIAALLLAVSAIPMYIKIDKKRAQARKLVPVALMAALCVVGRVAFSIIPLPNFKPVTAIVIITGIAFGPEAGYMTGTLAGFLSNFIYGQGPWTPWQMFCWGMIGLIAGVFQRKGIFGRVGKEEQNLDRKKKKPVALCVFGLLSGIGYGWVMNLYHIVGYIHPITWHSIVISYVSSIFYDLCHGMCTALLLGLLGDIWVKKLQRIKKKYGLSD